MVYRVEKNGLLIHDQIGIVGNAERNRVAVLKFRKSSVAGPEIPERIAHLNCLVHKFSFSDNLRRRIIAPQSFFSFFADSIAQRAAGLPLLAECFGML
jgi:hypothetical protein